MVMYKNKTKKNIKSKISRKKIMKKTRKRIYKLKGGAPKRVRGDCRLYFKDDNDVTAFRDYVIRTGTIRKDKKNNFDNFEKQQACVNQIRANYIP